MKNRDWVCSRQHNSELPSPSLSLSTCLTRRWSSCLRPPSSFALWHWTLSCYIITTQTKDTDYCWWVPYCADAVICRPCVCYLQATVPNLEGVCAWNSVTKRNIRLFAINSYLNGFTTWLIYEYFCMYVLVWFWVIGHNRQQQTPDVTYLVPVRIWCRL
jgi:hypothetical protein